MKIKKIGQFIKQYGFYLAIGIISVVAIAAMFIMPKGEGNVQDLPNSYANNSQVDGSVKESSDSLNEIDIKDTEANEEDQRYYLEKDEVSTKPNETESNIADTDANEQNDTVSNVTNNQEQELESEENTSNTQVVEQDKNTEVAEVKTETFESTTVSVTDEPFFADGDKFTWPVEGDIVVPYTDNSTAHWFSESLNYTMRTFGICISAKEETNVLAVAKGRVLEVIDDSSNAFESDMPYIGKAVVIDHGNGYQTVYGFQGGVVNSDLVGEVVNEGDVLGKIGSPKGAFINVGSNIYLQVKHNDQIIDPTNFLESDTDKEESVDVGFSE